MQHLLQIGETSGNPKALAKLVSHVWFPIANHHNLAVRNAMNGLNMLVGNLSTTDYRYTEQSVSPMTEDP